MMSYHIDTIPKQNETERNQLTAEHRSIRKEIENEQIDMLKFRIIHELQPSPCIFIGGKLF